jgi:PAS domain S-box-containing protein
MRNTVEIKRLQSCINDLISVLALPAIWSGSDSSQILGTLVEALLTMLRLDFAYARLDASDVRPIEVVRLRDHRHCSFQPQQFGQALDRWLTADQAASRNVVPDPTGEGEVSIASFPLGLRHKLGVLVAASRRSDFPTEVERLLLRVAANQAGIGLQEARRSVEQKQIAEILEERVAERTRRLIAVNEELRRSQAYLAEAQRLSHTGSFGWRPSSGEITWSEETFRVFGYDRTTIPTVELVLQRVHPEDAPLVKQTVERASQDGKDFEHEYRLVMPDGAVKRVHVVAHAEKGESGELEFVGAVMDVSDRKRAEGLLSGEKRLLEMVARGDSLAQILDSLCLLVEEQTPDVLASILLMDANGKQLRHGGAPSLPKAYTNAIDGSEIGPSVGSCGTAAYFGKQVIVSDITSDPLWVNFRELASTYSLRACWSTPIFSAEGKVIGTFALYYREPRSPSLSDQEIIGQITHLAGVAIQHKLAEDALRRSESYLAEAQRLTHTGSWVWRVAGREPLHLSDEWYRVYGFDPKDGMPGWEKRLERIHPEDRARFVEAIDRAVAASSDYDVEFRLLLPDGTLKYVYSIGHPVSDASGNLVQFVGSTTDMTERKLAEEALRQAQADLAYMNRVTTMSELAASLAHEIKQPIAAAVTDANTCLRWLSREHPDVEEARQTAARMVKDATRAAEIISRIRMLFKKGTADRELVDVNEVIREMILLLHSDATRYSISVRTELAQDLPPIMGDRVQLQQVIMNLITNSVDAMKDMDGMRELAITSQRRENQQLLLSVSDTGVGLPPRADQIFNAFFTTKAHGTGMGLPISRSIVESHGGRLWAGDNSPRGASFYLTLPITAGARTAEAR